MNSELHIKNVDGKKDWKIKLQGIFNRIKVSSAKFDDRIIEDDEMINKENIKLCSKSEISTMKLIFLFFIKNHFFFS